MTPAANPLLRLRELGQSIWYDYITRDLLLSGELARLIREDGLKGMTSNPTIFEKAIAGSHLYDDDIRRLGERSLGPGDIFEAIAVTDVQAACDAFTPLYRETGGRDGFVSLEVSPRLAHDTEGTLHEVNRLWKAVDRPNAMIKIPGTEPGLAAIRESIASGINVNVTLLFSIQRYGEVIEAFLEGLERRIEQRLEVTSIASVASFFVSRVDGKIDPLLDQRGDSGLRGKIAIANANASPITSPSPFRNAPEASASSWPLNADSKPSNAGCFHCSSKSYQSAATLTPFTAIATSARGLSCMWANASCLNLT